MSPRFTDTHGAPRRTAQTTRSSADEALRLRKSVEGLSGVGAGNRKTSHTVKRVGRFLVAILLVVLFGAILYLVAWKSEFIGGRTIPNVEGYLSTRAISELNSYGFTNITTTETVTDEEQEGIVIQVTPDPGTRAESDETITLEVATSSASQDAEAAEGTSSAEEPTTTE